MTVTYKQFVSFINEKDSSKVIEVDFNKLEQALKKEINDDKFVKKFIDSLKSSSLKEEVSDETKKDRQETETLVGKLTIALLKKLWDELYDGVIRFIKGEKLSKIVKMKLIAIATFFAVAIGLVLSAVIDVLHDKDVDKSKVQRELKDAKNKIKSITKN